MLVTSNNFCLNIVMEYRNVIQCIEIFDNTHSVQPIAVPGIESLSPMSAIVSAGVIGSDVPWIECPASNDLSWVITVTE